jgi:hypothetical protein
MNCEWVRQNLTLYVYDELADDERYELEQHVGRCRPCGEELEAARGLRATMSRLERPEPSPSLLAGARIRLDEALQEAKPASGWSRFTWDLAGWMRQARLAPALAAVIFLAGAASGVFTTYQLAAPRGGSATGAPVQGSIAAIRGILQEPGSDNVEIKYDVLQPVSVRGSVSDPAVQQLLLFAARSNLSSGVRLDSVDLLTRNPQDDRVREALMFALRYDDNPGVRLRALEGLQAWVKEDVRVRDAVLDALLRDSNPGVRTEAIRLLEPVRADGSVRQVLQQVAEQDQNRFIRSESRYVLASTEIH